MQIVIDIPEHCFEELKCVELNESNEGVIFHVIKCILNGTPLRKGHGRLIDADKLKYIYPHDVAFHKVLQHSKTVIKADKENKGNK